MSVGWLLLYALGIYAALGAAVGLAFVAFGVTRALEHPAPVSLGARVLLFPAAAAFWPVILKRWLARPSAS
jgi:hypothetical protein